MRLGAGVDRRRTVVVNLDRAELVTATAGGDLHVGGHTDAEQRLVAGLAPTGLLGSQIVVAGGVCRPVEWEAVTTRVVGVASERAEGEDVVGEEVAASDLDRVDTQLERRLVDESLQQGGRLRPTGAAIGAHRRGVGDRDRNIELDRRERIGPLRHASRATWEERADRWVGTRVADEPNTQPGEVAVAGATQFGVLDLAATVGKCLHVVAARRHPHHRPTGAASGRGDHGVLGVDTGLAPEPTADLWRDHPDLCGLHPEHARELDVQSVRHLRRGPEREASVGIDLGGAAVGFHRHHRHALVDVATANDRVGRREVGTGLVDDHECLVRPVAREDLLGVCGQGGFGIDVRRQWLDVGPHHLGRVLALLERLGEHDGDRFANEPHPPVGQRGPGKVRVHRGEAMVRSDAELGSGQDLQHARHVDRALAVDCRDLSVGDIRAHENRMELAGQREVGQVCPTPGQQSGVLGPQYSRSEDRSGSGRRSGIGHRDEPTSAGRSTRSRTHARRRGPVVNGWPHESTRVPGVPDVRCGVTTVGRGGSGGTAETCERGTD